MSNMFLQRAVEITTAEANRLRDVMSDIGARLATARVDLRQVSRTLDEASTRAQAGGQSGPVVARQLDQLRRRHTELGAEIAALEHSERTIEQLVRQIEMSSSSLMGDGAAAEDPWRAALMAQIIQGREEERVRLAREVHDGPAQVLAHVVMGLEHAMSLGQQGREERLEAHLRELRDSSRMGLHEVRRFIADLRPPALDQLGLAGALRELAGRFANAVGLDVRFEGMQLPRLAPEQELVIYRIAQEALNNAAKHAKGASILVRCGTHANLIYLQVRDDGPGFDPRTVAARTRGVRWGLRSMHERADLIGAKFQISSAIGKGTTIGLSLPIKGTEDR